MQEAKPIEIEVWYGDRQRFGHLGNPQRWVNVLGSVRPADRVAALTVSLNGGQPLPLSQGPDGLRLRAPGDFNAEIAVDHLREGENAVQLTATAASGDPVVRTVTLEYAPGRTWPLPYAVDWPTVRAISEAVQVVDGRWDLTPVGIRPSFPAYDRLVAVGDRMWHDYRLRVTAQVHGFVSPVSAVGAPMGLHGGFGLLFRWTGHYADAFQPSREWRPSGAIGWYRARWEDQPALARNLNISDAVVRDEALVETEPLTLRSDCRYVLEFAVRTVSGGSSRYTYRVWPEDAPERQLCDLAALGRPGGSAAGSVLLIALYTDVTIGRIEATPL